MNSSQRSIKQLISSIIDSSIFYSYFINNMVLKIKIEDEKMREIDKKRFGAIVDKVEKKNANLFLLQ